MRSLIAAMSVSLVVSTLSPSVEARQEIICDSDCVLASNITGDLRITNGAYVVLDGIEVKGDLVVEAGSVTESYGVTLKGDVFVLPFSALLMDSSSVKGDLWAGEYTLVAMYGSALKGDLDATVSLLSIQAGSFVGGNLSTDLAYHVAILESSVKGDACVMATYGGVNVVASSFERSLLVEGSQIRKAILVGNEVLGDLCYLNNESLVRAHIYENSIGGTLLIEGNTPYPLLAPLVFIDPIATVRLALRESEEEEELEVELFFTPDEGGAPLPPPPPPKDP